MDEIELIVKISRASFIQPCWGILIKKNSIKESEDARKSGIWGKERDFLGGLERVRNAATLSSVRLRTERM